MRKRKGKKSVWILGLLALAAFVLILFPTQSWAPPPVADNDGFTDADEQAGITLPEGMSLAATGATDLPNCSDPGGLPRDECMDETTPDLFVIVDRALECPSSIPCGVLCAPLFDNFTVARDASGVITGVTPGPDGTNESNIPFPTVNHYDTYFDPLALIESGLEITVHEIFQDLGYANQNIANHYAVRIVENLDPCGALMGIATFGTPYAGSTAVVFTEKIKNWIEETCSEACFDEDGNGVLECYGPYDSGVTSFECKNPVSGTEIDMKATTVDLRPLYYDFIQNIINHEVGHLIYLASGRNTSGHHYPMAEGVVMEQFIDAKATKDKKNNIDVILYISTIYSRASQRGYQLE